MLLKRLYASIRYEDLNEQDICALKNLGILNGYGGGGQNNIIKYLIGLVLHKFKIATANRHDYGYWLGTTPRKECDEKFFKAMIQDIINIYNDGGGKMELILNFYLCFIAYCSIRLLGGKYYNK